MELPQQERKNNRSGDFLNISLLADIYGGLLTERRLVFLREYHDNDLSYAEIGEKFGVSRQTVKESIVKACETLYSLENDLHLLKLKVELTDSLKDLTANASQDIKDKIGLIIDKFGIK